MKKTYLIIGMCIIMMMSLVSATDYYFNSTTGNDANDCSTSSLACKTISDLNGKTLVAGDNVISNPNEIYRINEYGDTYLIINESGSSAAGNISFYNFTILGSINASNTDNWSQVPQINITGTLSTTFYVNTQYYNITMEEGTIINCYSVYQSGFNFCRGDANVNLTTGAMLNGSLYLIGGDVDATTCTASNQSDSLGIGIRVNCSNSDAENVWTFYDSFITVNSTSKNGHKFLWQHAIPRVGANEPYATFWNGTTNKTGYAAYTDWESLTGTAAVSFANTSITNLTYIIDWDETKTTDFDYQNNLSAGTNSIRIARSSELTAGTYLFQKIKILPRNESATTIDQYIDVIDAFVANNNYNDTLTAGTSIWRFDTTTSDDVGNIVSNITEIGGESQGKRSTYASLNTQGEFYKDTTTNYTYVYSSTNPATYYADGLELSMGNTVHDEMVKISGTYISINGFDISNAGNAALLSYYNNHVYIQNSSFYNSGGIYESGSLRYGGCISFECVSKQSRVTNSFFYGCYDNAVGMEAPTTCTAGNNNLTQFEMSYNIIMYSGTGSAYSNSDTTDGELSELNTHHNTFYKIGYGWVHQRPDKGIAILFANAKTNLLTDGYNYTDNIVYDSHHEWINLGWDSTTRWLSSVFPNMNYNLYYLGNNTQKIYWNGSTYNNLSSFQIEKLQELNGAEINPNFADAPNGDFTPSGTACTMSSSGGYVGAVPCSGDYTIPIVNIISPSNGTTTSNNTLNVIFNYTDSNSTTNNCTLYVSPDVDDGIWQVSNSGAVANYTLDESCLSNTILTLRLHDNCQIPENDVMECQNSSGDWIWLGNNTGFDGSRLNEEAVYWHINNNYCYQESANVSDQTGIDGNCSQSYSGYYDLSNFVTPENIVDGDWGTFTQPFACANPYAYFNYSLPRQEINNASVNNNTNTNLSSGILSDGNYTGYVSCVDGFGNIGNSSLFNFLIDTSTPYINISNPVNGSSVNSNDLNITFSIVHNTTELSFDYYNISLLNGDFSFNKTIIGNNSLNLSYVWSNIFTNLSIGTYIIFIEGINSTGDTVLSGNSTFYLTSNSILNITVINYADNTSINTFTINITDETTGTTTSYNTTTGNITLEVINPRNYTIITFADTNHSIDTTEINISANTYNLTVTLYDYNALYITYYHELNMSIADGITIYHDIISDAYSNNYTTSNGTLTITGLPAGDYISRYYSSGFVERFFSFTITDYASQVSNLYLATNLTSVLITVRYTNYVPIEGATVKAQKFIVATNSYIDVESGSTDSEGQIIMSLTLNDEYYRFIVTIEGETVLTTEKAYIIDDEINLFISTGTTAGDNYFDYRSIDYNLYFDYSTNQFYCIFNDASNSVNNYCLRVLFNNGTYDSDCTTASAGNLFVNITPVNGSSYRGSCEVKLEGDWLSLMSITVDFDDIANFSREGLLLQFIISLIFILAVVKWPEFIPVSLSISLLLGRAMQINILSWEVLGGILLTAIIISSWLGRQSR